ncbi:MAG: hypothetical protein R3C59_09500 [Planctomycetaceae bacterium]
MLTIKFEIRLWIDKLLKNAVDPEWTPPAFGLSETSALLTLFLWSLYGRSRRETSVGAESEISAALSGDWGKLAIRVIGNATPSVFLLIGACILILATAEAMIEADLGALRTGMSLGMLFWGVQLLQSMSQQDYQRASNLWTKWQKSGLIHVEHKNALDHISRHEKGSEAPFAFPVVEQTIIDPVYKMRIAAPEHILDYTELFLRRPVSQCAVALEVLGRSEARSYSIAEIDPVTYGFLRREFGKRKRQKGKGKSNVIDTSFVVAIEFDLISIGKIETRKSIVSQQPPRTHYN